MPVSAFPNLPCVSLLIANYNNSRYLADCIQSVYAQTWTNWEIVILDDGSSDDFDQVVARFADDDRIKIYYNESNKGCSYTKCRLALLGKGSLMAYLDPDDALTPDALKAMVDAHADHPECSLVHSTHMICDENLVPMRKAEYPRALPPGVPYLLLSDGSVHAFASFKRSFYQSTAGLTPDRALDKAIDQELYYLLEEAGPFFFVDQALYYYRIHTGSISNMGNEFAATNVHYEIVVNRCLVRMAGIKGNTIEARLWRQRYIVRFHRVRIILALRRKQLRPMLSSLIQYPFVGGAGHLFGYLRRLTFQGRSITDKTLSNYKITAEKGSPVL